MSAYAAEMSAEWRRSALMFDEMDRLHDLRASMTNLGACLRIAGALCAARRSGVTWDRLHQRSESQWDLWAPGCGWPMPEVA